jgi:predicted NAD/FAD-binding protein
MSHLPYPMERIAIIGSGISGLGCAHFLHRQHDLTIFEAGAHIGGHTNTVAVQEGDREVCMDTGFMVYNEVTYPHLTRLFKELNVPTKKTDMSFSVQHGPSGVEWNGGGFNTLFAQRKNLLNLRHWRFLWQLNRFNSEAVAALNDPRYQTLTLAEYVAARGYGQDFIERYLVPMGGAVWSTPPDKMLQFPAITLLRFWHNHGFLGLHTQHQWRTVDGGSREYVKRLIPPFADRIHLNTPVQSVRRAADGVHITTERFGTQRFDRVIMASHADQSLRLLADATDRERAVLSPFKYQANKTHLHTSPAYMPKTKLCWAAWNYKSQAQAGGEVSTTTHYWMNRLQGVSDKVDYFVSLNAQVPASAVGREIDYEHPLFDLKAIAAQQEVPALNAAATNTYFVGAWTRYGFHEDGLLSAVKLCEQLLAGDPWKRR